MGKVAEDRPRAVYLADVLKALAHPERLRIVAVLCEGERNVIGLAERLDLPQAIVSQHLRILRMSGLVAAERLRGFSIYGLAQKRLRALVQCLEGCHTEAAVERGTGRPAAVRRRSSRDKEHAAGARQSMPRVRGTEEAQHER